MEDFYVNYFSPETIIKSHIKALEEEGMLGMAY